MRLLRRALILLACLTAAVLVSGVLVLRSDWFAAQVKARIVREVERATGGRAGLEAFRFDWRAMRAELDGFALHGLEADREPALFRARRVSVGLKVVSVFRRKVDLLSLELDRPDISISIDSQGRTNLPSPARTGAGRHPVDRVLEVAIGRYAIRDGTFRFSSNVWPLDAAGEKLQFHWELDRASGTYGGDLATESMRLGRPLASPLPVDLRTHLRLEKEALRFTGARIRTARSEASSDGEIRLRAPHTLRGRFEARASLPEVAPLMRLSAIQDGQARLSGTYQTGAGAPWAASGSLHGTQLAFEAGRIAARDVEATGTWIAGPRGAELRELVVRALDGVFEGAARFDGWSRYAAEGMIENFALHRLTEASRMTALPWSANVSGPVRIEGPGINLRADVTLTEAEGKIPLSGSVAMEYDERAKLLRFQPSAIEFPASRIHFSGSMDERIEFGLVSRNLDDLLPALALVLEDVPGTAGVRLEQSQMRFEGAWRGGVTAPRVAGRFASGALRIQGHRFDAVSADVDAGAGDVRFTRLRLAQGDTVLDVSGTAALDRWRLVESSALAVRLSMEGAALENLTHAAGAAWDARGAVSADVRIEGTYGQPRAAGSFVVKELRWAGERFEHVEAGFRYIAPRLDLTGVRLKHRAGAIDLTASVESGEARIQAALSGSRLGDFEAVKNLQRNLDGRLSGRASLAIRTAGARPELASLDGELALENLSIAGRTVGRLTARSRTEARLMHVDLDASVRGSAVRGYAEWTLGGTSFGLGQLRMSRMTFAALRDLGLMGDPSKELAFEGVFDGEIGFSGPVLQPELWTGSARIHSLEIEPVRRIPQRGQARPVRFPVRNQGTLAAHLDANGVHVQSAHLVGEGTDLEASGTISFRTRSPWNLRLRGRLNLPSLATFEPDLEATGVSTLDATVRGSFDRPHLSGRMEIKDASFFLRGLPNGLEKTNGTIVFDRTRANIEKLTAQTGGGELSLSGFVDLGGSELLYRLQANAQRVRVLYPESVSTTFNTSLSLTGTAARSVLGGVVTVTRVGIEPRTDIGSLLAEAGRTRPAPAAPNEFLRNLQLDVRLVTSPDAELQTSLARDIEPEADLRLRGSVMSPILLGRMSVHQGEINFFGNQYTISRGDISFFNPARIEPVLDLDLETRIRGIVVNINFTGPLSRLNVSYRSDPPLQTGEIVALLTVGRTPGEGITPTLPAGAQSQSFLQAGSNSLLGQAISAPLTGRLQRLFGVSRIKIDPELTGVTNTPQARLSVEQQLSREITVTYITNLNRTQQQIVRLQWDFSRDFSVLAVRDDNGVFGVDFLWRRRFK